MSKSTQIKIKGMHCGGCESIIEEALTKVNGVIEAKANYSTAKCLVVYDEEKISLDDIYQIIEGSGYQVELTPDDKGSFFVKLSLSLLALVAIVLLMVFSRKLWHQFSVPEISSQLSYGMIFVVGLITGLHCIGMCGSFVISYTVKDAQQGQAPYLSHCR